MNLNQSNLLPYEGSYLKAFNGIATRPWRYMEQIVYVGDIEDI